MSHRHFILTHRGDFDFPLDQLENPDDYTVISDHPVTCTFYFTQRIFNESKKGYIINETDKPRVKKEAVIVPGVTNWQLGEIPAWKYIYDQLKDGDTATLHHYRRKLLCTGYGIYGHAAYLNFGKTSVINQTAYYHSNTMCNLLRKHLPKQYFDHLCRSTLFAPYNLFYADKKTIGEWLNFQTFYLSKIMKDVGDDVEYFLRIDYAERGGDTFEPRPNKNISVNYQRRFYAFISERLSTLFWCIRETEGLKKVAERYQQLRRENKPFPLQEQFDNMTGVYEVLLLEENQKI